MDNYCRTSVSGIYAAGDVTNVPYKQIMIAMGEGAKAALSAFDDRIRGVIWRLIQYFVIELQYHALLHDYGKTKKEIYLFLCVYYTKASVVNTIN